MQTKYVGYIMIAFAVVIGFIVYIFNKALTDIVSESCSHGPTCPMWGTIDFQTYVGLGIMGVVIIIGLYLIFFGDKNPLQEKAAAPEKASGKSRIEEELSRLQGEEKQVIDLVVKSQGTIFQSELVDKTGLSKVKVTRILDKLEGKGLIERKRRGMTNVVIIKH